MQGRPRDAACSTVCVLDSHSGCWAAGYVAVGNCVMPLSHCLTLVIAIAGVSEWLIVGPAIGLADEAGVALTVGRTREA
jgi:hypothetical protein